MAELALCRVDSRLVHGQVVTKWINQSQSNRIVIVSDMLVKDSFLLSIYEMSAPPGVKINCYSRADVVEKWNQDRLGEGRILLLFPDIATLKDVFDAGMPLDRVQVGGLGGGPNRKVVFRNVTLDNTDLEALKSIDSKNVKIIFQTIPEDNPVEFNEILKKF